MARRPSADTSGATLPFPPAAADGPVDGPASAVKLPAVSSVSSRSSLSSIPVGASEPASPDAYSRTSSSRGVRPSGDGRSSRSSARPLSLKARALAALARRDHSRLELSRKLAAHEPDADVVAALLDELQQQGWLSDTRFAQGLVRRRGEREGAARITRTLREHGVDEGCIAEHQSALCATEPQRLAEAWARRFSALPADTREYARQYRFLATRGFAAADIRRHLGAPPYGSVVDDG